MLRFGWHNGLKMSFGLFFAHFPFSGVVLVLQFRTFILDSLSSWPLICKFDCCLDLSFRSCSWINKSTAVPAYLCNCSTLTLRIQLGGSFCYFVGCLCVCVCVCVFESVVNTHLNWVAIRVHELNNNARFALFIEF